MNAKKFFRAVSGKKLGIVTHSGCDVDAFGAAASLYFTFKKKSKITIIVPEHINLNAKALARHLKVPYKINNPNLDCFDFLIVVDANSFAMLGNLAPAVKAFGGPILVIDHHSHSGDKITSKQLEIIHEKAVSTTEIIFELLKEYRIPANKNAAAAIACGIITDSAGFLVADSKTFRIMSKAMELSDRTYLDIVSLFALERDISEKIAKLKAAKRVRIYKSGKHVIATTTVGAHEASAAMSLVTLGADIAFAGDTDKGEIRISGRANNQFVRKFKFDLTKDIFDYLEKEFSGEGGGHAAAAAYNGTGNVVEPLLKRCVALAHKFIQNKQGSNTSLKEYD